MLSDLISTVGFKEDPSQGTLISKKDAWQHNVGYFALYDIAAPLALMHIHCEPIRFTTSDRRNWNIEFWKGQYGVFTGAEVGIYTGTFQIGNPVVDHYLGPLWGSDTKCAEKDDWLRMSFDLKRNGQTLFTRNVTASGTTGSEKHWWITAFKLGEISSPRSLTNVITIFLKDRDMLRAFVRGLRSAGYQSNEFTTNPLDFSVTVTFGQPKLFPQPNLLLTAEISIEQIVNYLLRVFDNIRNNYGIVTLANFLVEVYNVTIRQIVRALYLLAFPILDIFNFLTDEFDLDNWDIVELLYKAGFSASQVGNLLIDDLDIAEETVADLLNYAGYGVTAVGNFFKNGQEFTKEKVAELLAGAEYTVTEVGNYFSDTLGYANNTVARLLRQADFTKNQVGTYLKNELNLTAAQLLTAMVYAGFTLAAIKDFILAYYNLTVAQILSLFP